MARLYAFVHRRIVLVLSILLVAAGALLAWRQSRLHSRLESTAMQNAQAYSDALATFRQTYGSAAWRREWTGT